MVLQSFFAGDSILVKIKSFLYDSAKPFFSQVDRNHRDPISGQRFWVFYLFPLDGTRVYIGLGGNVCVKAPYVIVASPFSRSARCWDDRARFCRIEEF